MVDNIKLSYIKSSLAPLIKNIDPNFPLPTPPKNITSVVPNPTLKPTVSSSLPSFYYYHTSGNQIVDRMGISVKISAINW
jgi:hypothetical protein